MNEGVFTKLSEVPILEKELSTDAHVLIENNNEIVRIPESKIKGSNTQADWNETDEDSPAFIMNKPSDNIIVYYAPYPNTELYLDKSYTKKLSAKELRKALENEKNLFQVIGETGEPGCLERIVLYGIAEHGNYFYISGHGYNFKVYK